MQSVVFCYNSPIGLRHFLSQATELLAHIVSWSPIQGVGPSNSLLIYLMLFFLKPIAVYNKL